MDWKGPTWGQMADATAEANAHIAAHAESARQWMAYAHRLEQESQSQQRLIESQRRRIEALEEGRELREQATRVAQLETQIETLKKQSTAGDALWSLFLQARSQQAGLQSVVATLTEEIAKLDPTHRLLDDWWRDTIRGPAFYAEWDRLKEVGIEQVLADYKRDGGHVDVRSIAATEVRIREAPKAASSGCEFKL